MKQLKNVIFLIKYSWQISKRVFLCAAIRILFDTIEFFVNLFFPAKIIDILIYSNDWYSVVITLSLFIVFNIVIRILRIVFSVYLATSVNQCDAKNGLCYARQFLNMDYEKLENSTIRDIQGKIIGIVHPNNVVETIVSFFTSTIKLFGLSTIIISFEPIVFFIVLGVIILNYLINKTKAKTDYQHETILAKFSRLFSYLFTTMTSFEYAKDIRVNKADSILSKKYNKTFSEYIPVKKKFLLRKLFLNLLSETVALVQMLFTYGYVTYRTIIAKITLGDFNLYIGAISNLAGAFDNLVSQCISLKYLSCHVDDYKEYMEAVIPQYADREVMHLPEEKDSVPMFEFKDVSFVYPNTEKKVLKNISIKIYKGEKLAVVGLNGAGKTTFIKLLCRLYTPTNGVINYYGVDISTIKRDEYLEMLAVVFQDFRIFSFSLLENIILNKEMNEEKFNLSIKHAGILKKIETLPNGVNTSIYKDFDEDGIEFSGGEAQKLVIARAYYKDASMVILDEPTAALDALSEYTMYESFNEITYDKTAIFISHRLASTRFCDNIAVFSNGEITEYGHHTKLMENCGLYHEMFEKQAQYYKDCEGEEQLHDK